MFESAQDLAHHLLMPGDVEAVSVAEMLWDNNVNCYQDLSDAEQDAMIDEVFGYIDSATVTVEWH